MRKPKKTQALNLQILRLRSSSYRRHGLSRSEFLQLTPFELYQLDKDYFKERNLDREFELEKWKASSQHLNVVCARLMAAIYNNNPNRKKGAKVLTEQDFLPKKAEEQKKVKPAKGILNHMKYIAETINSRNKEVEEKKKELEEQKKNGR